MTIYCFFKDFGSPLATLLGAIAALTVTWKLGSRQSSIAHRQSEIARNKLRLDLFDKRFVLYKNVEELFRYAYSIRWSQKMDSSKLDELSLKTTEGQFLFPEDDYKLIKEVVSKSIQLINFSEHLGSHHETDESQVERFEDLRMDLRFTFEALENVLGKSMALTYSP